MAGPTTIQLQETGSTPIGYTLSPGQTFECDAATAIYDGTGAGGNFVPALGFYANNGRLIARTLAPTTVNAGDTAEVSFFPSAPPSTGSGGGGSAIVWDDFSPYLSDPTGTDPVSFGDGNWAFIPGESSPDGNDSVLISGFVIIDSPGTGNQILMALPTQPAYENIAMGNGYLTQQATATIFPFTLLAGAGAYCSLIFPGHDTRVSPPAIGCFSPTYPITLASNDNLTFVGLYWNENPF